MSVDREDAGKNRKEQAPAEKSTSVKSPPNVLVRSPLLASAKAVPFVNASLLAVIGQYEDGSPVLAPYVELRVASQRDPEGDASEPETLLAETVSFENAAYIVAELCGDMAKVGQGISSMTAGDLRMDSERLHFVLRTMDVARTELDSLSSDVRQMLEQQGVEGTPDA